MFDDLSSLIVKLDKSDGDTIHSGADEAIDVFDRFLEILGIGPTRLFTR